MGRREASQGILLGIRDHDLLGIPMEERQARGQRGWNTHATNVGGRSQAMQRQGKQMQEVQGEEMQEQVGKEKVSSDLWKMSMNFTQLSINASKKIFILHSI